MKIGRYDLNIDENDLILDNGACYQIITKEVGSGWNSYHPIIAKKTFKEFKTCGMVFTSKGLEILAEQKGYKGCSFWKFNMEIINKMYG